MTRKLLFAVKSLGKLATQRATCPYCGGEQTRTVQRKHLVLQLRKCGECSLQFRFPKDRLEESRGFYQDRYQQRGVTDLPAAEDLPAHIARRFTGIGRDLTQHLQIIRGIAPSGKVLDYGSSWGYCVFQFQQAGYHAQGFEISRPRVDYGRKALQLDLTSDINSLPDASFDLIYSAHCLEHISNPDMPLKEFKRLLKPGGYLFVYVPNCAGRNALDHGVHWGPMIGEKHVLALTPEFFHRNLPKYGFEVQFSSSPYEKAPQSYSDDRPLSGDELLIVGHRL